jgi:hypothetical protein
MSASSGKKKKKKNYSFWVGGWILFLFFVFHAWLGSLIEKNIFPYPASPSPRALDGMVAVVDHLHRRWLSALTVPADALHAAGFLSLHRNLIAALVSVEEQTASLRDAVDIYRQQSGDELSGNRGGGGF